MKHFNLCSNNHYMKCLSSLIFLTLFCSFNNNISNCEVLLCVLYKSYYYSTKILQRSSEDIRFEVLMLVVMKSATFGDIMQ
jgi:hypothetical protein